MITKMCEYRAAPEQGERLVQVFHPGDVASASRFFGMEKTAAPLLPEVASFLHGLKPDHNKIYVLVNAMGASEYWGQNINGDLFPEASLIHRGRDYGYETFYGAHPFKHHVNKDPNKSFGDVMVSVWNPHMKRVELVIAIDRERAEKVGASDICDKLDNGSFLDVSMGCKVPYDLCTICTDWRKYYKAEATYDPSKHQSIGKAVLAYNRQDPIRGLSPTTKDYCDHLRFQLNKIMPDGKQAGMINRYPRFFDISFVFIGADRTAKVMAKLASTYPGQWSLEAVPSWYVAETCGYGQECDISMEKSASIQGKLSREAKLIDMAANALYGGKPMARGIDAIRARMKKKTAQRKLSEIVKDIVPSQFHGGVSHVVDGDTDDIPESLLDQLGGEDSGDALSTASTLGMILKPHEFQRIMLVRMGRKNLADMLGEHRATFSPVPGRGEGGFGGLGLGLGGMHMRPKLVPDIVSRLLPMLSRRSCFEPVVRRRVITVTISPKEPECSPQKEIDNDPLLSKISSAYNSYLDQAMYCMEEAEKELGFNPEAFAEVYGIEEGDLLKTSSIGKKVDPRVLFGAVGGAFLLSQLAKVRRQRAEEHASAPPSLLVSLAAEHPNLLMALAGLGALHQQGSSVPKRLIAGTKSGMESFIRGSAR
jgi:hypothetical protein